MQRIAIFGGTGNTGLCAVDAALKKGLKIKALVRTIDTVPESIREQIEVIIGDVLNQEDVDKTVEGVDAVCVALGTRSKLEPTTMLSEGMKNIVQAMKNNSVQKVSICLSAFLFYEPDKVPKIFIDLNADHQRMLDVVKNSGLDYVAILPPHIADLPSSPYTIGYEKSPGRSISKWDLGSFLITSLENPDYNRKVCGIANSPK